MGPRVRRSRPILLRSRQLRDIGASHITIADRQTASDGGASCFARTVRSREVKILAFHATDETARPLPGLQHGVCETSGELSAELVDRCGQCSVDQVCDFLPPLVGGVGMYEGGAVVAGQRQQLLRDRIRLIACLASLTPG